MDKLKSLLENEIHFLNFATPADHRVKMKENKKMNKYLDLIKELKK